MSGLSRQTRLVAGFAAVTIHVAIGAQLMLAKPSAPGLPTRDSSRVLVMELLPLETVAQSPPRAVAHGTGAPATRKTRSFEFQRVRPGAPAGDAAHDAPVVAFTLARAGTTETVAAAGASSAAFQQQLLNHIGRFRRYPTRARRDGIEGVALLNFAMDRDGRVTDAWVEHSSGSVMLDAEALAAIQRAQPLPTIPAGMPDHLTLLLPIAFTLS